MSAYVAYKYNPAEIPVDDLEKTVVGREHTFELLENAVWMQSKSGTFQHYILLGPRGIGKTTLLLIMQNKIRKDPVLSQQWFPVRFHEEEFGILNLRDLLALVLEHLAVEENIPEAGILLNEAEDEPDEEKSFAKVLDGLRNICITRKKRLLLLLDNFDRILPKKSDNAVFQQTFRKLLEEETFLMVIGTSVCLFDELAGYDEAISKLFSPVHLESLDSENIKKLLMTRARQDDNTIFLTNYKQNEENIRAIIRLMGGNPRLVMMLYDVLSRNEIVPVKKVLREMIDILTPFLKGLLVNLPGQQSKVLDTMMRINGIASPSEIARNARLPLNVITTQLGRLKTNGLVNNRVDVKSKRSLWYVSDQLFRAWYQMRYLRPSERRTETFVEFLSVWFSIEKQKDFLKQSQNKLSNKQTFTDALEDINAGRHSENEQADARGETLFSLGALFRQNTEIDPALENYVQLIESGADLVITFQSFVSLIILLCREGRIDLASSWLTGLGEIEPIDAPLETRLKNRMRIIIVIAKTCDLSTAAGMLNTLLENSEDEIKNTLAFLQPALDYARTKNESVLVRLPPEEQEISKRIAQHLLDSR